LPRWSLTDAVATCAGVAAGGLVNRVGFGFDWISFVSRGAAARIGWG
jgi:hypothetical protein